MDAKFFEDIDTFFEGDNDNSCLDIFIPNPDIFIPNHAISGPSSGSYICPPNHAISNPDLSISDPGIFIPNPVISGPSNAFDDTHKRKLDAPDEKSEKKTKTKRDYIHVLCPSPEKIDKTKELQDFLTEKSMSLYRHQIEGIVAACFTNRLLFCHEMGLGKTIMSLMVPCFDDSISNTFIFVPPGLRRQWCEEITKLTYKLKLNVEIDINRDIDLKNPCSYIYFHNKTKIQRCVLKYENDPKSTKIKKFWIWSHSREVPGQLTEPMDLFIFDEVHNDSTALKRNTRITSFVEKNVDAKRIGLSGTLFRQNISEVKKMADLFNTDYVFTDKEDCKDYVRSIIVRRSVETLQSETNTVFRLPTKHENVIEIPLHTVMENYIENFKRILQAYEFNEEVYNYCIKLRNLGQVIMVRKLCIDPESINPRILRLLKRVKLDEGFDANNFEWYTKLLQELEGHKQDDNEKDCSLCGEDIEQPEKRHLSCGHYFFHECNILNEHLEKKSSCPICRKNVPNKMYGSETYKQKIKERISCIQGDTEPTKSYGNLIPPKYQYILEYLSNLDKDSMIIVCPFVDPLNRVYTFLMENGINAEQMCRFYDKFKDPDYFLGNDNCKILLTTYAKAEGHNFTKANHMIVMAPTMKTVEYNQMMARIYRIGQKKEVFINHLISHGSEQELFEKVKANSQNIYQFLEYGGQSFFTCKELQRLFFDTPEITI